ncbi:hypothetical protein PV10_01052 [Exophiala mesophila]|uniref:LysM domain-containing protein n=1 Tax=Exophiala mesophila TaxID=212818 RepID=A0A0D1ZTM5_EXOME|nr:uncharacterized protein PV10_01052 [Exophiala mesophila]KIV97284.1 hypothetical protein PV10_01052 [Exophiala mesophila]
MAPWASCCTCATLLDDTKKGGHHYSSSSSEKPILFTRHLDCCQRDICATCQNSNPRFQEYCPFCQISTGPSALPKEGLRLPPSYTRRDGTKSNNDKERDTTAAPPSYDEAISVTQTSSSSFMTANPSSSSSSSASSSFSSAPQNTDDIVHHLSPTDTLAGLSVAYGVPVAILRRHNHLFSDTLVTARKWLLIPATHYSGPSLSKPPDAAEEERKLKLRRWMVATKCADYTVAQLYLKGADGDLDAAVALYKDDDDWERNNPLKHNARTRNSNNNNGRSSRSSSSATAAAGFVAQLSR